MDLISQIVANAKAAKQRIVLPESLEERTLTAADQCLADDIADIILIGAPKEIFALGEKLGLTHLDTATIIDPTTSEKTEEYAQLLFELRKSKGMTIEEARKKVLDPLYFGCLIIKNGDAVAIHVARHHEGILLSLGQADQHPRCQPVIARNTPAVCSLQRDVLPLVDL